MEIVKMDKEDANTLPEGGKSRQEMSFRYRCYSGVRICYSRIDYLKTKFEMWEKGINTGKHYR